MHALCGPIGNLWSWLGRCWTLRVVIDLAPLQRRSSAPLHSELLLSDIAICDDIPIHTISAAKETG